MGRGGGIGEGKPPGVRDQCHEEGEGRPRIEGHVHGQQKSVDHLARGGGVLHPVHFGEGLVLDVVVDVQEPAGPPALLAETRKPREGRRVQGDRQVEISGGTLRGEIDFAGIVEKPQVCLDLAPRGEDRFCATTPQGAHECQGGTQAVTIRGDVADEEDPACAREGIDHFGGDTHEASTSAVTPLPDSPVIRTGTTRFI